MVTEMTIYKINDSAVTSFEKVSKQKTIILKKHNGFIRRKVLQDSAVATFFIDIVDWESQDDALEANIKIRNFGELNKFNDVVDVFYSSSYFCKYNEN